MQKFLNKSLTKKVILVLVVAILCNFIVPTKSLALDVGIIVDPVKNLLSIIADSVEGLLNVCFTGVWIGAGDAKAEVRTDQQKDWAEWFDVIDWPTILVTPEQIFKGNIIALRANFLKPFKSDGSIDIAAQQWGSPVTNDIKLQMNGDSDIGSTAYAGKLEEIRGTIAGWYVTIRNISAAALFCVLIYIGIRILLSSVSEERAKYKSMIINWLVAICLVFVLHYIMAAIMFITENAVEIIGKGTQSGQYVIYKPGSKDPESFSLKHYAKIGGGQTDDDGSREPAIICNLTEMIRVYVNLENRAMAFGYLIIYYALIILTVIFVFRYLKRFMYMAFLTMIAPLIAFTYPIDKVKDGTAQAFNKWFIEYLFNALLQPIHLLIYVALVGSAANLVQTNFIYAIVALAFISKAEKLIKDIFGLNKASTPPSPGGSLMAANLIQSGYSRLRSGSGGSGGSSNSGKSGGNGGSQSNKVRQKGMEVYANSSSSSSVASSSSASSSQGESQSNPRTADVPGTGENGNPGQNNGQSEQSIPPLNQHSDGVREVEGTRGPADSTPSNGTQTQAQDKRRISRPAALLNTAINGADKAATYTAKKFGRGAIRTAAFAATAMPMLAAGAIAYAATGDAKYLGMGVGAAHALSGRATDAILPKNGRFSDSKLAGAGRKIRTAYRKEKLGEDGASAMEKYDNFLRDKDNLQYLRKHNDAFKNMTDSQIRNEIGKNEYAGAQEYIKAGYSVEDVNKLMDVERGMNGSGMTHDQIMAAYNMSSGVKDEHLMDEEKSQKMETNLAREIKAQSGGSMDDHEAREKARNHMNAMRLSKGYTKRERLERGSQNASQSESNSQNTNGNTETNPPQRNSQTGRQRQNHQTNGNTGTNPPPRNPQTGHQGNNQNT